MRKILTIAHREYLAMVGTKAFLIGLAMMPILMLGGLWVPKLLKGIERPSERRIAVIDGTGKLFAPLSLLAEQRNSLLAMAGAGAAGDQGDAGQGKHVAGAAKEDEEERKTRESLGFEDSNRYRLEQIPAESFDDARRLELSEQIRKRELYAFVELPRDLLEVRPLDLAQLVSSPDALKLPEIVYCSEDSALSDARRWLDATLNQLVRAQRLAANGVSPEALLELERRAQVRSQGLYVRNEAGEIVSEEKPDELLSVFLPMAIMMLMFMIIMMSAQPMLESVLEERTMRISEVLLGSANARQLMTGKLLGNVAGSLTVFALYAGGTLAMTIWRGYGDKIPYGILPWFVVYQTLAVLMFSSLFLAIGASVSQLREAQSLLLPIWMVILLPMMVWFNVVREPNSTLATSLSFFPPSTPMMMTLRLATGATVPTWQILLSFAVLLAGTACGVIAASRIYRVGILWQGNTPRLGQMLSWIVRDPASPR